MTKNIFIFSLVLLSASLIWILKVKQDIDSSLVLRPDEIFMKPLSNRYKLLKAIKTGNNTKLAELFDTQSETSVSFIRFDTEESAGLSSEAILNGVRKYRVTGEIEKDIEPFLLKYLSAHLDARRITPLRNFQDAASDTVTFRKKDERYYAFTSTGLDGNYLLLSNERAPLTEQQVQTVLVDILGADTPTVVDHEHAQVPDQ